MQTKAHYMVLYFRCILDVVSCTCIMRKAYFFYRHSLLVHPHLVSTLQVQQGSGGPPTSGLQGVGVPVSQQGMFMAQGVAGGRAAGFPVGGMGNSALQGPLAFLEKTTSNIGMPERRS